VRLFIKDVILIVGTAFAIIFPLLMASTINIQTAFWVFSALVFIVCELGFNLDFSVSKRFYGRDFLISIVNKFWMIAIALFALISIKASWAIETQFLKRQKSLSEIAFEISKVLSVISGDKFITANFRGIGALDNLGLSWGSRHRLIEGSVRDIYSKNREALDYLDFDPRVSFFISAHENYFFPNHFGINDNVQKIHSLFTAKSDDLGFKKVAEISRNSADFDIWYRPNAQPYLQYIDFGDTWIGSSLPVAIGNTELCGNGKVSGKLNLSITFPNPNVSNYKPPFFITMSPKNSSNVIASAVVNHYGDANVSLVIQNADCGIYHMVIDKTFSTSADSRTLSAQFVKMDSNFKFDSSKK